MSLETNMFDDHWSGELGQSLVSYTGCSHPGPCIHTPSREPAPS